MISYEIEITVCNTNQFNRLLAFAGANKETETAGIINYTFLLNSGNCAFMICYVCVCVHKSLYVSLCVRSCIPAKATKLQIMAPLPSGPRLHMRDKGAAFPLELSHRNLEEAMQSARPRKRNLRLHKPQ